jgi:hypothetical protein
MQHNSNSKMLALSQNTQVAWHIVSNQINRPKNALKRVRTSISLWGYFFLLLLLYAIKKSLLLKVVYKHICLQPTVDKQHIAPSTAIRTYQAASVVSPHSNLAKTTIRTQSRNIIKHASVSKIDALYKNNH